jgi:hypothetical protein
MRFLSASALLPNRAGHGQRPSLAAPPAVGLTLRVVIGAVSPASEAAAALDPVVEALDASQAAVAPRVLGIIARRLNLRCVARKLSIDCFLSSSTRRWAHS